MINYLVLTLARGVVRINNVKDHWRRDEFAELKSNSFFTNSLSYNDFNYINRYFSCDLKFVKHKKFFFQ